MYKIKKLVISCQVLYREILELVEGKDIDVEFLPQGLHNFPDSEAMRSKIQETINTYEQKKEYDCIILGYGLCGGGVEGLKAEKASLVIPLVHDCIPILLGGVEIKGNIDSGRTYYLSRGWIDCGGDTYKEYLCLVDKMQSWVKRFKDYQQQDIKAMVEWHKKERYKKLAKNKFTEEMAKYVSFECLKNYQSITLIDSGNLAPIHWKYTDEMYNFINDLLKECRGKGVDCRFVKGDLGFLKKLLFFENLNKRERNVDFLITPPGKSLRIKKRIISSKSR